MPRTSFRSRRAGREILNRTASYVISPSTSEPSYHEIFHITTLFFTSFSICFSFMSQKTLYIIQAFSTVFVAIATIAYVIVTCKILKANQRLVDVQFHPSVSCFLNMARKAPPKIVLYMQNNCLQNLYVKCKLQCFLGDKEFISPKLKGFYSGDHCCPR
jgi:hypothetical protein